MPNDQHFRRLENMHHAAACNRAYYPDLRIAISEGKAEITLPVHERYFHAAKAVHGFVYFKLLDEAGFFAANSLVEDVFVLTTDYHTNLLRPVSSGTLRATGQVVHQSKNQILAEAVLYNAEGKQIARGSGTFVKGATPLNADIGYKD
jgi:uncharacterized protein (TIGR00369 family)